MQGAQYTAGIRIHKGSIAIHHHNHLHTLNNSPTTIHTVQTNPRSSSPNTIHPPNLTQPPTHSLFSTTNCFTFSTLHSLTSFKLLLPVPIPCPPSTHQVTSATFAMLSCTSPAN